MPQTSNTTQWLNDISFSDLSIGWAVGNLGTLIATLDGGETWLPQPVTGESLYGVCFTDQYTGWLVGGGGSILHTDNSGAVGVQEQDVVQSSGFKIQSYPNPTGGIANLQFTVCNLQSYSIKIFDMRGREIWSLVTGPLVTGQHNVILQLGELEDGIYLVQVSSGLEAIIQKIILLK